MDHLNSNKEINDGFYSKDYDELDLSKSFSTFRRNKFLIAGVSGLGVLLGLLYSLNKEIQ